MYNELLDESVPINLDLLEQCVITLYEKGKDECNEVCNSFKNRSDSFSIVEGVLQSDRSYYLKIYSLMLFSDFVQNRWESVSSENKTELRDFIAQYINHTISTQADEAGQNLTKENRQNLVRYANLVLLNILKYDWPDNWPNFIPDILEASFASPEMCANTFFLLQNLTQEFTEFAENTLSTNRQGEMNNTFLAQFQLIVPVMEMAISSTENPDLVNSVLKSLKYFLKTIDPTVIFNSKVFHVICETLLPDIRYTINCIAVFGEIVNNRFFQTDISSIILQLFQSIVESLSNFFPVQFDINGNDEQNERKINLYQVDVPNPQDFIHIFITSMTSFISSYQSTLENKDNSEPYSIMLKWIFNVTMNADSDSNDFLFCIQFWNSLCNYIYTESIVLDHEISPVYNDFLCHLRRLTIRKMACPNEIIYIVDETGIHSRKENIKSQTTNLYFCMREMIIYLTHIDREDMIASLFEKVEEIKESETFSSDQINCLCWAAGSLGAGALSEEEEGQFFTNILEYLLQLFKSLPDDKMVRASVASGIMYVCSQFRRFLMNFWDLLKVVMDKLFEFMNEIDLPLVQDSAIESMKTIVKRRCDLLVKKQEGEESSYLEMMIQHASDILSSLSLENVIEMYEIFSILIQQIEKEDEKEEMITIISSFLNSEDGGLALLASNIQPFDQDWLSQFTLIIKCTKKIVKFLGYAFYNQLKTLIPPLLQIYSNVSDGATETDIESEQYKKIMGVKSMIIKLLITSVRMCGKNQFIIETILPPSIEIIMPEYAEVAVFKEPKVLSLFAYLSSKLHTEIMEYLEQIFKLLIIPTLPYLNDYTPNYPYWKNFITLIQALVQIPNLLTSFSEEQIKIFMDYLKLCCEHPQCEISENALQTLMDLLSYTEIRTTEQFFKEFIDFYGMDLMKFVMNLLTDSVHKFAFNSLLALSKRLISLKMIQSKEVDLFQMFTEMFPNRPAAEIRELIENMIQYSTNFFGYRETMRNFLISARKFAVNDPALYAKDKEEIQEELKKKAQVPGLLPLKDSPEVQEGVKKLADTILSFNLFK